MECLAFATWCRLCTVEKERTRATLRNAEAERFLGGAKDTCGQWSGSGSVGFFETEHFLRGLETVEARGWVYMCLTPCRSDMCCERSGRRPDQLRFHAASTCATSESIHTTVCATTNFESHVEGTRERQGGSCLHSSSLKTETIYCPFFSSGLTQATCANRCFYSMQTSPRESPRKHKRPGQIQPDWTRPRSRTKRA